MVVILWIIKVHYLTIFEWAAFIGLILGVLYGLLVNIKRDMDQGLFPMSIPRDIKKDSSPNRTKSPKHSERGEDSGDSQ
jgi:hypothetical protein